MPFYLYINYQKLNNIIIKNRYLFLNMSKLHNNLLKVYYFINLDLRKA